MRCLCLCWCAMVLWTGAARAGGFPVVLRGPAAVLLKPEPGELAITLTKRDLNLYAGADTLGVILVGPQRETLASATLPDDGEEGKGRQSDQPQQETLRVAGALPGVYRLMVTGSSDLIWGFETNSPRFVFEGGPMLNDGTVAGKVYFKPPAGKFAVAAAAIHEPGRQQIPLLDAAGKAVQTFDLMRKESEDLFGKGAGGGYVAGQRVEIPAGTGDRGGLWAFNIAHMDVRLAVDGVKWWTTAPDAWFDAGKSRWMLLPYAATRYLRPGEKATLTFTLRNGTGAEGRFRLAASSPDGLRLRLVEPASPVSLAANAERQVRVEVELPAGTKAGASLNGGLTASHETDPDAVASAGVVVRCGEAPARRPLSGPIILKPYQHENMLLGYAPGFFPNEVYFDRENRAVLRQRSESAYVSTGLLFLDRQGWQERSFMDAIRAAYPGYRGTVFGGGFLGAKVAFDGQGGAYTLVRVALEDKTRPALLIFTPDQGHTYTVQGFPADGFDIEQFNGHNALDIPPPVVAYRQTRPHPAPFCGYHDLLLYLPRRQGNTIALGEPVKISDNCVGSCQHSGGPASTATRAGKTHIVWGEVAPDDAPRVPTYIATFNHATRALSPKVFLGNAPPVNDVHNVPAIAMDSAGFLHVLTGAHGEPFQYLRSLKPNDISAGFTQPVPVLDRGCVEEKTGPEGRGRQTYISLVCGPDDTLHIAYRQWRSKVDPYHGGRIYAALSHQSKPKNGPWSAAHPLVVPPLPNYSIYYHKLTVDRRGRLFLAYSYLSGEASYQDDFPNRYHHPALLVSTNRGATWKLADTDDVR